jgi:hypothetical protein
MRKTAPPLLIVALALGVAACGSGNTTSTPATATTSTSSAAAAPPTTSTATASPSSTQARRLTAQAQHLLNQLAAATGKLASPSSSQQQRAQQLLAQVHASAAKLQSQATTELAPGNPTRAAVIHAAKDAAMASREMQGARASGTAREGLFALQGMLVSLSANLDKGQSQAQQAEMSKLAAQLKSLGSQLAANATKTTGG